MEKIWINIPDVLFFQEGPGVRNTQYTTEGVKLLNVANLVDGKVDLSKSDRYISEDEAYGKYKHFLCDAGDFVIASSGIKVEYIDKKMGFVDESMLPLCMNTSTIRFKVLDDNKLRIRYFMYYLKSQHFKDQLFKQITGSAQLNYGPSHLKKMIMPLISLSKQDEIIACMDKVQSVIEMRRQELVKLDDLIKARFVEMFGDVIHNSKKWQVCLFAEITSSRLGKMLDAKQQTGRNSYPYLANFNVQWFRFNLENLNKMDFDEKDRAEFELREGDLLVCEGGEIGRCAVWHNELQPCFFQKALHRVRCNHQIILPDYLAWWFRYNCDYGGFSALAGAKATIAHLPGAKLKQLQVAVPPMELQEQFAVFVAQTDKSKVAVQKALDEAQLLFDSLMQEYFG